MLAVADVAALAASGDALSRAIAIAGCARITLCTRRDIWCLVEAEDTPWILQNGWGVGWGGRTRWKHYTKRNEGAARSTVWLHRVVLIRATGVDPDFAAQHAAHHRNGQSLDCRRANLEWLTVSENCRRLFKRIAQPSLESIVAQLAREANGGELPPY